MAGGHGQTGAFSEQAGGHFGGTQQNEQQVSGGGHGQTGAFSEQAGHSSGSQQNEQQVSGSGHGQTGAFNEQSHGFSGIHREPLHTPTFHGTTSQPETGIHNDLSAGTHSAEPESYHATSSGESHYDTPVHEESTHVTSDDHSFEDAGHAAATESADAGHDGADAGQEMHHS